MRILVTGGMPHSMGVKYREKGHDVVTVSADAYIDEKKFIDGIQGFDIYISGGLETCTKSVIESTNQLKAIGFLGVDPKNYIDLDTAKERNIPVHTTPGANARAVAELSILLILNAVRKAVQMFESIGNNVWQNNTGFELQNKTIGLIGSGPIAQNVSKIAQGFGMKVLYWSRSGAKDSMNGDYVTLQNLFESSDIISLHVPKDAGVILDKAAFEKIKKGAVVINTAPATLVDFSSLYDALSSEHIASAAFDCFYSEGEKAFTCEESKLLDLGSDRFFISPHAGWRTIEADEKMFNMILDAIG
jgi:phosphoglycerate dehydrogenase-like enzyme